MLPLKYRLKNKETFGAVFQKGKTVSNDVLLIKFMPCFSREVKIGFAVSLKFSKKSSQRNKVKRWMRAAVWPFVEKIRPGFHVIFLINSKCDFRQLTSSLIREKTENLLARAKLLI